MARDRTHNTEYTGPLKRLLMAVLLLCLLGLFLLWRIDSPRVERFRAQVVDRVVPNFDWAMAPVTGAANILRDFQSYQRIYQQNQDLRRELQQMKAWKEAALQLEQENARLPEPAPARKRRRDWQTYIHAYMAVCTFRRLVLDLVQ